MSLIDAIFVGAVLGFLVGTAVASWFWLRAAHQEKA